MVLTILSFSAIAFVPAAIAAPATYTVNVVSDESDALVGDEVTVNKYIFTDVSDIENLSVRKYNPNTDSFVSAADIPGTDATIEATTIGGQDAIHLTYKLTDGQLGDDDLTANGIIVDPVGLAHVFTESQVIETPTTTTTTTPAGSTQNTKSASGTLSTTGANSNQLFNLSLSMLFAGLTVALIAKAKGRKAKV